MKGCDVVMPVTIQAALPLGELLRYGLKGCGIQYRAALPIGRALDKEM